jgi:hypothetical protein
VLNGFDLLFFKHQGDSNMKNIVLFLVVALSIPALSFAGDCQSGNCAVVRGRKVVIVTKSVVRETVVLPKRIVSGCANGVCRTRNVTVIR